MPEIKRKVRTYEQLDRMLCKRPTRGNFLVSTNVYGKVNAAVDYTKSDPDLILRYVAQDGHYHFEVARVWRVANGDTVYRVAGCKTEIRKEAAGRKRYRNYVQRLTPRVITGRTPREHDYEWFRIRDGVATHIEAPPKGRPFHCRTLPKCVLPTIKEWLNPAVAKGLPKFVARSRAFAVNLRRELGDSLPCVVQLITERQTPAQVLYASPRVCLHVCTPPTATTVGRRLVVAISPHDTDSRAHFHVDGDYAVRHSQFACWEYRGGKAATDTHLRWPCARDAIVGIKEWVLGGVFIPGPE
jgi:hypothetical protein